MKENISTGTAAVVIENLSFRWRDGDPDVLAVDERQSFLDLLSKEVGAAGATLVYVSHDRSLEGFFDRTVKLPEVNRVTAGAGAVP